MGPDFREAFWQLLKEGEKYIFFLKTGDEVEAELVRIDYDDNYLEVKVQGRPDLVKIRKGSFSRCFKRLPRIKNS